MTRTERIAFKETRKQLTKRKRKEKITKEVEEFFHKVVDSTMSPLYKALGWLVVFLFFLSIALVIGSAFTINIEDIASVYTNYIK